MARQVIYALLVVTQSIGDDSDPASSDYVRLAWTALLSDQSNAHLVAPLVVDLLLDFYLNDIALVDISDMRNTVLPPGDGQQLDYLSFAPYLADDSDPSPQTLEEIESNNRQFMKKRGSVCISTPNLVANNLLGQVESKDSGNQESSGLAGEEKEHESAHIYNQEEAKKAGKGSSRRKSVVLKNRAMFQQHTRRLVKTAFVHLVHADGASHLVDRLMAKLRSYQYEVTTYTHTHTHALTLHPLFLSLSLYRIYILMCVCVVYAPGARGCGGLCEVRGQGRSLRTAPDVRRGSRR